MGKLLALKQAPANRAAIIDEFGDVEKQRREFAPTERRHKQLLDEIKSWYESLPGDKDAVEKGTRYQLAISMRANATTVDVKAAHKKLGLTKFLKACTLTLKALGEYLSQPEIDALTATDRTGSRSFVTTPLVGPPPSPDSLPEAA